jgi:hypothetical protein
LRGVWESQIARLEEAAAKAHGAGAFAGLATLSNSMARCLEGVAKLQGLNAEPSSGQERPAFTITINMPESPMRPAPVGAARGDAGVLGCGAQDAPVLQFRFDAQPSAVPDST